MDSYKELSNHGSFVPSGQGRFSSTTRRGEVNRPAGRIADCVRRPRVSQSYLHTNMVFT